MKKNKKLAAILLFCLAFIVTSTAVYADIAARTGYDQLKAAAKATAANMVKGLQSFTIETTISIKDNDMALYTIDGTQKIDYLANATERTEKSDNTDKVSYSYSDSEYSIWKSSDSDIYFITEQPANNSRKLITDPFEEERIGDIEKIIDALVGNLKDCVVAEDKPDGSQELSGSLNEAQIPPLVNAVSSFYFKQSGGRMAVTGQELPELTNDIFIKNVKGRAIVNKDGIVESSLATFVLSGNDRTGASHDLTFDILFRLTGINSTIVSKPDLTGKKVEKRINNYIDINAKEIPERFLGTYKNDIVVIEDGQFVKIGERLLQVERIEDGRIKVRLYEVYKEAYAADYENRKLDISLEAVTTSGYYAEFTANDIFKSTDLKLEGLSFDPISSKIRFDGGWPGTFDGEFNRVFED